MTDPGINPATGKRPGPGQPPKLTPELQDKIVQVVRAGNYLKVAAQYAGIGYSTLQSWLARGRAAQATLDRGDPLPDEELRYLRFLEAVTQADTQAEVAAVTHWRAAFANDWRAARDYLVRRNPDRWAATTRIAISNDEAEARIARATEEALLALGIDTDPAALTGDLDPPNLDWLDDDGEEDDG